MATRLEPGQDTGERWTGVVQSARIGAATQVICMALPLLDLWLFGSVRRHVASAYPDWTAGDIDLDRNAIVGYLVGFGILALAGWLVTIWVAKRGRGVRGTVTALFIAGTLMGLVNAGTGADAYAQIVPLWLGVTLLVLPLLPGATATLAAWSGPKGR